MKKAMFFAAVAAIAAATILSAASAGTLDSATGSGHLLSAGELRSFSFSANRLPDGTVRGEAQINARSLDAFAHIAIDCLQITGNVAQMSGTVVHTSDPTVFLPNEYVHFAVQDNGEGAAAPPDRISGIPADEPFRCDGSHPLAPSRTVVRGNVQVR
jgi:hypothetical protein